MLSENEVNPKYWPLMCKYLALCIYFCKKLISYDLVFSIARLYGKIMHLRKLPKEAIEVYLMLRDISYDAKSSKMKVESYRLLGRIYQLEKEHHKAIICYKKMLAEAWVNEDHGLEQEAYTGLSKQYYYFGQITKCKMYFDRSSYGIFEGDGSQPKQVAV